MDTYFLNRSKFNQLYNCTNFPFDIVPIEERRQPLLGIIYMVLGIFMELLYLPCIMAIWRHMDKSAYKIMLSIACVDIFCLPIIGILHGYLGILGAVFCSYPVLIYVCGCISQQLWAWEAFSAIILGINRCLEIAFPHCANCLFNGWRTWLWLCIPAIYSTYFGMFNMPILFTAVQMVWVVNPFEEYARDPTHIYYNPMHIFNNIFVLCTLTSLYMLFALLLWYKIWSHSSNAYRQLLRAQKMPFLQVLVLSIFHVNASGVYIYIQYFPASEWVIQMAMFGWLFAHGCPPVVYLLMNKTIRTECIQMSRFAKIQPAPTVVQVSAKIHQPSGKIVPAIPRSQ